VWNHLFKPLFKMNKIFKESWIKIIKHHQFWICVSSIPITCCHPELDPRLTQCQLTMLKVVLSIVIYSNNRPSRFAYLAWGNDWNHHQDLNQLTLQIEMEPSSRFVPFKGLTWNHGTMESPFPMILAWASEVTTTKIKMQTSLEF
jgi:hypothetical protein